ncbi:MAG TPA: hypothetical protein VN673_04565, partial [Clostridia bacterium]|nr:hypothetical protein [Clostridia bacterium]
MELPNPTRIAITLKDNVVSRRRRAAWMALAQQLQLPGIPAQAGQILLHYPLRLGLRCFQPHCSGVMIAQFAFHALKHPSFELRAAQYQP